jgi:uncharacterized protein YukE
MANGNTNLAPDVATKVANDHRTTADDVGKEQNNFNAAVDEMDDVCTGDMMTALLAARDEWTKGLTAVIADLVDMAGNVDGSIHDLTQRDQDNAGAIGKVGVGILADI